MELKVRLKLANNAALQTSDVGYGLFPEGKRCCFTYTGPVSPASIGALSKLGFRTTVYAYPGDSAASLKALEDAGADIGINIWGGKRRPPGHPAPGSLK